MKNMNTTSKAPKKKNSQNTQASSLPDATESLKDLHKIVRSLLNGKKNQKYQIITKFLEESHNNPADLIEKLLESQDLASLKLE